MRIVTPKKLVGGFASAACENDDILSLRGLVQDSGFGSTMILHSRAEPQEIGRFSDSLDCLLLRNPYLSSIPFSPIVRGAFLDNNNKSECSQCHSHSQRDFCPNYSLLGLQLFSSSKSVSGALGSRFNRDHFTFVTQLYEQLRFRWQLQAATVTLIGQLSEFCIRNGRL